MNDNGMYLGGPRSRAEPKITCCVFAWNEVVTLRGVVDDLLSALRALNTTFELLIIDDGSSDGTSEVADRAAADNRGVVRVIHHGDNRGLGGVYRTGFESAHGTYLTFFPADGQFPAELLARFFPLVERYDMVLGNLPKRTGSLIGAVLSRTERLLYAGMFGRIPRLEGVFIMRREILSNIELKSRGRGWTVLWELLIRAHRRGYRTTGCEIYMQNRIDGTSKVNNVRTIAANLQQLWELRGMLKDERDAR